MDLPNEASRVEQCPDKRCGRIPAHRLLAVCSPRYAKRLAHHTRPLSETLGLHAWSPWSVQSCQLPITNCISCRSLLLTRVGHDTLTLSGDHVVWKGFMPAIAPPVNLIGVLSIYIDITSANLELPSDVLVLLQWLVHWRVNAGTTLKALDITACQKDEVREDVVG